MKLQFLGISWDFVSGKMGFELGALLGKMNILSSTSDHTSVVSLNVFIVLLCICIVIGHLLEENRWMNESITALIIVSPSSCLFVYDSCRTYDCVQVLAS